MSMFAITSLLVLSFGFNVLFVLIYIAMRVRIHDLNEYNSFLERRAYNVMRKTDRDKGIEIDIWLN